MAKDRLEELKSKYQSVLDFMESQKVRLQNVHIQDDKLLIRATAPSQELKHKIWDQIKLVDPKYADLIADIQAPMAAAAAAGGRPTSTMRTYKVQPGDTLSKISKEFYGDANQYMKIFKANTDKLSDPNKIKPGMDLIIP
jgi:nucleoid-associated protein YgaU